MSRGTLVQRAIYPHIYNRNNNGTVIMTVHNLYFGSWQSNCYAVISRDKSGTNHAAIIDPSTPADKTCSLLDSLDAQLDMIILTHGHFDHIMSLDDLARKSFAPVYIHENDAEMLRDSQKNAYSLFFPGRFEVNTPCQILKDGDTLKLADEELTVMHLPGHTQGSIGLIGDGFILTGDTLFDRGVGRSDLYGGDAVKLYSSISRLKELDPTLKIYPGHGKSAELGRVLETVL